MPFARGLSLGVLFLLAACLLPAPSLWADSKPAASPQEITQYQGQKLDTFHRQYDNAVENVPERQVSRKSFRLKIDGLVERPLSLSYAQVLALPSVKAVVNMPCVEGWSERLLFQGVPLAALLKMAGVKPQADTVVFHGASGRYTSSLDLSYVRGKTMLAYAINGLELDIKRGFPFQVVAPKKLGYKWVKWVTRIQVTSGVHEGFWEIRGYDNQADTTR